MQKRKIIINDYDTATYFWTLASWSCPTPSPVTNMVNVTGRVDGPLDFSTVLTGDIMYNTRTLTARLESSEGSRLDRQARIDYMINRFHGRKVKVWLPDDPDHYVIGRLDVKQEYNDLAHAAVNLTAVCEPWKHATEETAVSVAVQESTPQMVTLVNDRRPACPVITVTGEVNVEHKGGRFALSDGTYKLPDIVLTQGDNELQVSGAGSVTFTYRKAVL